MNETLLMIFIGVSSLAIIIQAAILAAMYATTKKTSEQIEKLALEVRSKALPAIESVQSLIATNRPRVEEIIETIVAARPRVEEIVDNVAAGTSTARSQLVRIDATLNDALDRTRLQIIRADELATATMDKIEETTEIVQHTIVAPVRRLHGVINGISTGLGMFVASRKARKSNGHRTGADEDMFI